MGHYANNKLDHDPGFEQTEDPEGGSPFRSRRVAGQPLSAAFRGSEKGTATLEAARFPAQGDAPMAQFEADDGSRLVPAVCASQRDIAVAEPAAPAKRARSRSGPSENRDFNDLLKAQAECTIWRDSSSQRVNWYRVEGFFGAMDELQPTDPIEGMLVNQIMAAYSAAMRCFALAMDPKESFERQQECLKQAPKLMRSFNQAVETRNRYRGKGQQHIRVERFNMSGNAQAVVGSVTTGNGRCQ